MSERMRNWVVWSMPVLAAGVSWGSSAAFGQSAGRKVIAEGEITANDVYVRSGDSLNHYTICKLDAGHRVRIVGERGAWYEILPPDEAFSLISGDYVDSTDDRHGVVNGNNVRVRSGSVLNDNKYTVQLLLDKGSAVTILGRHPDGFLKIAPPTGATVWVNKSYVAKLPEGMTELESSTRTPAAKAGDSDEAASPSSTPAGDEVSRSGGDDVVTKSDALARIDKTPQRETLSRIDASVNAELRKPVVERRLEPFLKRYEAITRQTEDLVAQKYAQVRVTQLADMIDLIETVRKMRRLEEEAASERRGFQEGRAGIRTVRPSAPVGLDAEGVLRPSALYPPGSPIERYRLVDSSSGQERTVAYVEVPGRSGVDAKRFIGRRVGVRASAKRWQQDSVHPLAIYVASEFVELDEGPGLQDSGLDDDGGGAQGG